MRSGTQSIQRAVLILRELASRDLAGWGLQDLATRCELDRATVHRILKCLIDEGLVQQRACDKRYLLGSLNFELGISVPSRAGLADATRSTVHRLAREFPRMTVLSVLRSGDDCVCVARAGPAASEAAAVRIGQRVPLLSRSSGVAIIAALPQQEARDVCRRNRARLAHLDAEHLSNAEELVRTGQRDGHIMSIGALWHGVNSIAVSFGPSGAPVGSLALATWNDDSPFAALTGTLPELQAAATALTSLTTMP